MIVTPRIFARLAAIAIVAVLLQLSFFSRVELLHTSADILPAVVVSLGLLGGSLTGAAAGFSIGFLVDCLLIQLSDYLVKDLAHLLPLVCSSTVV